MPIPMPNQRKEVRTPQVAKGQALNLSKEAMAAAQPHQHTLDLMNKATEAAFNFTNETFKQGQEAQDATELQRLTDAMLVFSSGMDQENAKTQNMTNQEFLDYRQKKGGYDDTVRKLHNDMLSVIDTTKNRKLAEQYRAKVNEINESNAANLTAKTDKSRRESQITSANALIEHTIQTGVQNNLKFTDAEEILHPGQAFAEFERLSYDIERQVMNKLWAQGVRDYQSVYNERRKWNEKLANQVIRKMNQTNLSNKPWEESKPGIDFLERLEYYGLVGEEFANKEFNRMESENVIEEMMFRPEQFVDDNGNFKFSDRLKNAPHMTHYEYDRILENAKSIAKNIKDKQDAGLALEMMEKADAEDIHFQWNHGMPTGQLYDYAAKRLGMTKEQFLKHPLLKAFDEKLKKNAEKNPLTPSVLADRELAIHIQRNTGVLKDRKTGAVVAKNLTPEEADRYEMFNSQDYVVIRPLQDSKELIEREKGYRALAIMTAATYDTNETKYLGRDWEHQSSAPAKDVLYSEIINTFREAEKATGEIPITTLNDVYHTAMKNLSSGIKMPSEYQINGKQLDRKIGLPMTEEINYQNKNNLAILREGISLAMAQNLPKETSFAIMDAMNRRALEKGEKQWTGQKDFDENLWDKNYTQFVNFFNKHSLFDDPAWAKRLQRNVEKKLPFTKKMDFPANIYSAVKTPIDWLLAPEAEMPTLAKDYFEDILNENGEVVFSGTAEENRKALEEYLKNNKAK